MLSKKEISKLKFDKDGLIPAIVVDAQNKNVLMLAYMNKESLNISIEKKLTCFWSRSRGELWTKGETSGNYQHIKNISADCDWDTLKIEVVKDGPACHTGNESCFFNKLLENEELKQNDEFTFNKLLALIKDRKKTLPKDSYTTYLFQKGIDKILKKVGEESTEVIIAAKADDKAETIYEICDLAYHILVLMAQMNIEVDEIKNELAKRQIINHKVKQEKMT